jgi:hypothetical protein
VAVLTLPRMVVLVLLLVVAAVVVPVVLGVLRGMVHLVPVVVLGLWRGWGNGRLVPSDSFCPTAFRAGVV